VSWVEARISCSAENAWTTLREMLCLDINCWRQLAGADADSPSIVQEDVRLIVSTKEKDDSGESVAWARIERKQNSILVRTSNPSSAVTPFEFNFVPKLNDTGECRLWLGDIEMEFWQVSLKILEPILFPFEW